MIEHTPKKTLNGILFRAFIFQVILIGGVLLLFPDPELLVSARDWVQKLVIILLFEIMLWPIFVAFIWKNANKYGYMDVARAVKHAFMGPYMFIMGILFGVAFMISLGAPAPERGNKLGTWFWKGTGQKIRDVYENDDANRTDKIMLILIGIGAIVLVLGGIKYFKSGIKLLRQIKNNNTALKT